MSKMPKEIWALNYEGDMGHGEWDNYQPFDETMATPYIQRTVSKEDAERAINDLEALFSDKNPHFNVAHHLQARWLSEHKETIRKALEGLV